MKRLGAIVKSVTDHGMLRSVIFFICLVPLSGCATVSMVSGQAIVETGLVDEKSSLEKVCDAYEAKAQSQGWVESSPGILGLARTLVDGGASTQKPDDSYLAKLRSETSVPEVVIMQIVADMHAAANGLEIVSAEAEAALAQAGDIESGRSRDWVMSFEGALVTAQKGRRNFIAALEQVRSETPGLDTSKADEALFSLNSAIDDARLLADQLAGAYSMLSPLGGPANS